MLLVSKCWSFGFAGIVIPVIIIGLLWVPVFLHYRVPRMVITEEMIESARSKPGDALLAELDSLRAYRVDKDGEKEFLANAEQLLRGVLILPGRSPQQITIPFDPADLDKGLFVASLGVPELLLTAYELSGRREFLTTAKRIIVEWARYEQRAWLPRGLLWNDHALSDRMIVLAKFWRHYRRDREYQPIEARLVLELAARTSMLLADPSHFTFATNHGVMQNLALWHYSLAFPTLPSAAGFRDLAFSRMRRQMSFQISDEGVVLEHSPSYQLGGLLRLRAAVGYLRLMNTPVPHEWAIKHDRAKAFYRELRLPDGSLPVFGDTSSGIDYDARLIASETADPKFIKDLQRAPSMHNVYPISGYSISWAGVHNWPDPQQVAQLALTWSNFPGHAHKHSDELSLWLWARGRRWITNTGDWPSRDGRRDATSWSGSNAPHLADERANSERTSKARYQGSTDGLTLLDIERTGPNGFAARRQVLWMKPDRWLVIDQVHGATEKIARTIWTVAHDTIAEKGERPNSFVFKDPTANDRQLAAVFFGSPQMQTKTMKGSLTPFAGWEVIGGRDVKPAPAVVMELPAEDSWAVSVWSLSDGLISPIDTQPFRMERWKGSEDWRLRLPLSDGIEVERTGERVILSYGGKHPRRIVLQLDRVPDSSSQYQALRAKFDETARAYPAFEDHFDYRVKATQLLIGLFLAQELFLLFSWFKLKNYYPRLRALTTASWSAAGIALVVFFDHWIDAFSQIGLPL